jgi:basic amino acid/polyamine antiporter, APA family
VSKDRETNDQANDGKGSDAGSQDTRRRLTCFDSVCLIVGIIIGAGIFETSPLIARNTETLRVLFGIWICGGILSMLGAFCYAELGATYPNAGGDYDYLTRAYGPWAGFLFGWMQTVIVRPCDVALMAFVAANYGAPLFPEGTIGKLPLALSAVVLLTVINILGVQFGKMTQNILTVVKVVGLFVVFAIAITVGRDAAPPDSLWEPDAGSLDYGLAMILVLFTFGGWNEMAFVAAEVKNPGRNIARGLCAGITIVTLLYVLVTYSFVTVLGHAGLVNTETVGRDVITAVWPDFAIGPALMSGLVVVAALGSLNGLIFAGSRITYAVGRDYQLFEPLGRWNRKTGTPILALTIQAALACTLVIALGSFTDTLLYAAAPVYGFYIATSVGLIVLRSKDSSTVRPFRVPIYPLIPIIFATSCSYLIWRAVLYKPEHSAVALGLILLGIPVYFVALRKNAAKK